MSFWMSWWCTLGSNFGQVDTPGKVNNVSMFFPFVDNGSDWGLLKSKSPRNGFLTLFQIVMPVTKFQIWSCISLNGAWYVAFWVILTYFKLSDCGLFITKKSGLTGLWNCQLISDLGWWINLTGWFKNLFEINWKMYYYIYSGTLCLILKFVWWSETLKCNNKKSQTSAIVCKFSKRDRLGLFWKLFITIPHPSSNSHVYLF